MVREEIIKVLVVDDSAFMRKLIQEFLSEVPSIAVVGTARNGQDAIAKIRLLKPHVVTMDVEMPVMSGLEALKIIMKDHPLPVIMLSSTTVQGAENAFLAMDYGAVDFIAKPSGTISLDLHKVKKELVEKVIHASSAKISTMNHVIKKTPENKIYTEKVTVNADSKYVGARTPKNSLVLIGTSTGGPRALQEVLSALPKQLKAPVVVVQHMPPGFTKSLAARLNQLSELTIKEAEQGDVLKNGHVYIAPGDYHMTLTQSSAEITIRLDQSPPRNGHRPSVDVMFESAAQLKIKKIAVIMTGMGADGSKGLVHLHHHHDVTSIAESKETCVVYGMPKAAATTGLISYVDPLPQIAGRIAKLAEG
ncbi:chemotaxis response regulator protein-glutamate methylesterase [Jeotgalibacillus sp. R-1-5s-1]|uniref:protein-glutamate methylesterase/protein-glutamine glutaminase n=1 Tax=Jeotgalibacillus sp. R-1-5s-1 TaxID=2555897 RepID=UPI00106B2193|nr:chemotaxis response regulator protein-glutamate methylesterase [Jeotgalibacillus sp. R-1-5s-1]TFE03480.1 chemotaxis response regulator protein-glutamate methylesterase [Jeotgalibacillus sp. R-1-5s-1]